MSFFRCYALNQSGRIVAASDIEADRAEDAIKAGWDFIATQSEARATGLEIWQGGTLLFSTDPKLAAYKMSASHVLRDHVENRP